MEKTEMQTRAQSAQAKIGAAMTMMFFGKDEQALDLLKQAMQELSPIVTDKLED